MFQDKTKTKKMVVKERESTLGEYENYTNMDAIVKYTAEDVRIKEIPIFEVSNLEGGQTVFIGKEL